jgi:hypothetical protein
MIIANQGIKTLYGGKTKIVDFKELSVPNESVILKNINVLSPDGKSFLTNYSVLISEGIIIKVDSFISDNKQVKIIDGTSKYLIPGLIDSHVHLFKTPNDLLLYVANGVTHIREMIGEEKHLIWKKEIKKGRVGPELYIASPRFGSFDFMSGLFMTYSQGYANTKNSKETKEKVIEYYKKGYDGIKIYSQLNKECYQAVSETTDSLGMDMIGHIPFNIELSDVWHGNQKEVAHFEEIMNALNREFGYYENDEKDKFFEFIDQRSDSIANYLIANNIAVTSTLWGMNSLYRQKTDLESVLSEIELKYVNPGIIEGHMFTPQGGLGWLPDVNRVRFPAGLTEEEQKGRGDYWLIYAEACQRVGKNLYELGVHILAGTDANLSVKVPGFSLHDEFKTLNEMGMSPAEVLRSSTILPAKWLNKNIGQIKEGFEADLVILNKNPLESIENTESINSVILGGRVLDRQYLDKILLLVEEANESSRNKNISDFIKNEN